MALLADIGKYSAKMRNNAGGHYNHEFFWKSMQKPSPISSPSGGLLKQIEKDFGSWELLKHNLRMPLKIVLVVAGPGCCLIVIKNGDRVNAKPG